MGPGVRGVESGDASIRRDVSVRSWLSPECSTISLAEALRGRSRVPGYEETGVVIAFVVGGFQAYDGLLIRPRDRRDGGMPVASGIRPPEADRLRAPLR